MAQGVCSVHVISLHLAFSILMFHSPSLLLPHGHIDTSFQSAPSLPNCSRSESAGQAHFHTSGGEYGYLADPTHSTVYEPKEFDKITSPDGYTTPINDPNYDNISDFSKTTRENIGLFGVPTVLESSVSNVSHGHVALQKGSQESMLQGNRCKTGGKRKRRFCDQNYRVDVKEVDGTVLGVILFGLTGDSILMDEISENILSEELNRIFLVKIQFRENQTRLSTRNSEYTLFDSHGELESQRRQSLNVNQWADQAQRQGIYLFVWVNWR